MTAAVRSVMRRSTEARSLKTALGNPGTCGANIVSQPSLPDADMVASVRPWKPPSNAMISHAPSLARRPHLRASLMAPSLASAPLLQKNTRCRPLVAPIRRASSIMGAL